MIYFTKTIYKEFLKSIEFLKKQDDEDRNEDPKRIPLEWDISIKEQIRKYCRKDHKRYTEEFAEDVMRHLVEKGILIKSPYGGYMFPLPTGTNLPSKTEFIEKVMRDMQILGDGSLFETNS